MQILVSNIGSTSFKFRLFEADGSGERALAGGGADRIGGRGGVLRWAPAGADRPREQARDFPDHGAAIRCVLDELVAAGVLAAPGDLDAVAFKTVMGGAGPAVARVDEAVLARLERYAAVAPAHNPPYLAAMRLFAEALPDTPLVACFETGFHETIPPRRQHYAVPPQWARDYGIRQWGFHGASHRYIAERTAALQPEARRVISCHLGGSSSLCAIRDGQSVATSMGLSAQTGLPQATRCGDFDPFALAVLAAEADLPAERVLEVLGGGSGLAALSGTSGDIRDIRAAIDAGDERARLALDVFTTAVRDYLGAYLVEMGGADAVVFTGGIGQFNPPVRAAVCERLDFAGIRLDADKNTAAEGDSETRIDADGSAAALWVLPTNEEKIVARQAAELLRSSSQ